MLFYCLSASSWLRHTVMDYAFGKISQIMNLLFVQINIWAKMMMTMTIKCWCLFFLHYIYKTTRDQMYCISRFPIFKLSGEVWTRRNVTNKYVQRFPNKVPEA